MVRLVSPARAAIAAVIQPARRYSRAITYRGRHRVTHGEQSTMDFTLGLIALLEEQTPIVASLPEFTYPEPAALPSMAYTARAATFTARPATFTARPAFNAGPPSGHPRDDADLDEPQRPLSIGETMWRRAQLTQALGRSRVGSAA